MGKGTDWDKQSDYVQINITTTKQMPVQLTFSCSFNNKIYLEKNLYLH